MNRIFTLVIALSVILASCTTQKNNAGQPQFNDTTDYAVWMANTVLQKYPDLFSIEERTEPKWSYTYGLLSLAMLDVYQQTHDTSYYNYAKMYADSLIDEKGIIKGYDILDYNIDEVNSGCALFMLYAQTGDQRYKTAIDTLRSQLVKHPRTKMGGFWHKQRYPHQMWLDGVYMGAPFYAQYSKECNESQNFDEIAQWIINVEKVTRDTVTGLLYHGWDESREQAWANKETGCSPHFWGRGMGWYAMALVDVLDYFPAEHPKRPEIIAILNRLAEAAVRYQDAETGVWYQILDQGTREGNYLEGSVSAMLSYFLLKGVNNGYLDASVYLAQAKKAYQGTVNHLVTITPDSLLVMTPVCAVAGLGGNPYRDGSYDYYINEAMRDNDPKAVGPFIMASIEYRKLSK